MPLIPFPDVPVVPGVPAVFRQAIIPTVSQLARVGLGTLTELIFGPRWGLYGADARPILVFDTFLEIRFKHDSKISESSKEKDKDKDYFAVTDKVTNPFEAIIRLGHAGDKASRNVMLSALEQIVRGTELYDLYTPEIIYPSVNPVSYSYDRNEKSGASLLLVDLTVRQALAKAPAASSPTKEPSGAKQKSNGQVQPIGMGTDSGRDKNGAKARGATQ